MLPDEKIMCHRTAFKVRCYDGVLKHHCRLWCHVSGTDAMNRPIDVHGCADELTIKFMHEVAKEVRHATASTDKVANEVRAAAEAHTSLEVHLINGIKASYPLMQLAQDWQPPRLEDRRDDEPST